MATEIELKLITSPEALRRVPALAAVRARKAGRARTQRLITRYFDTPDGRLRRAGMALRLRQAGTHWLQAVKSRGASVGGMQSRGEWEVPVAGAALSLEAFKATPAFKLLGARGFKSLAPVFETDFSRTLIPLAFADGSAAELCLDQGRIKSGRRSAALCEIELELKQGRVPRLFELADELAQAVPLRIGHASKAERGQALAARRAPRPVKAAPSRLERGMQPSDALLAVVQDCAGQLLANEAGVLAGRDIEFLHQARVALRRLRSALALFDDTVQLQLPAPVAELIADAGNTLGAARDWDVFRLETLQPFSAAFPGDAGVADLARRAGRQRAVHARGARQFLSSERYVRGTLGLGHFLSAPVTASSPYSGAASPTLVATAAQILQAAHKQVRKKGRQLQAYLQDGVDGEGGQELPGVPYPELHRLRIRAKKLRYAAEFFEPLFPGQSTRDYIQSLAELQDALGGLNDCATAERLLTEIVPADARPELQRALARAEGWLAAKRMRHVDDIPGAWARFSEHKRFWKKHLPDASAAPPPAAVPSPPEFAIDAASDAPAAAGDAAPKP